LWRRRIAVDQANAGFQLIPDAAERMPFGANEGKKNEEITGEKLKKGKIFRRKWPNFPEIDRTLETVRFDSNPA